MEKEMIKRILKTQFHKIGDIEVKLKSIKEDLENILILIGK